VDKLTDEQLAAFDTEYVDDRRWPSISNAISLDFPTGRFSFLDLGGGNGVFADRVLNHYPEATGTVLDASTMLLRKNTEHARKRVMHGDAALLVGHEERYDIIFINWLLHHLVSRGSYRATRQNIRKALQAAKNLLLSDGRLSVFENDYDGFIDGAPGRLIFALTSSAVLAPLIRSMGANTAGVGVCFLSHREWEATFKSCGLHLLSYTADRPWRNSARDRALLVKTRRCGHYWLA
jgi:SAM-dependent methyltransferase